ncbi:UNVERIFIED_CONTAM: hypothetical protein PYX00_005847 [Menopon gallinae]|uniref:Cytosolic Fe-S cluster assembly factor NUBP2 homolog n=1 Tax=Menopon gallinae TaxID=328185 RepID=A0AAW2HT64_9NEOP
MLDRVKNVIIVLSGKGGVGKSTVSTQIALALRKRGFDVGLLDVDLCGPSVPYLLNLENKQIFQSENGWVPVYTDEEQKLAVMSIGFLLRNRDDGVVWRGPKKTAMIKQFLNDVDWQSIDYLVIDTPPGTSDEHITVMENLRLFKSKGAVIVTTPQAVAIEDVRKEVTFCKRTGIPILGIIENMSGYVCPFCSECTNLFSSGGGESLAEITQTTFLGRIPLDNYVSILEGSGMSVVNLVPHREIGTALDGIVDKLVAQFDSSSSEYR